MEESTVTDIGPEDVAKYSVTKLCLSADYYSTVSPAVSKFHVKTLDAILGATGVSELKEKDVCLYCGQLFRPGNHTKHLKPKTRLTSKIRQLQNKANSSTKKLGKFQESMLKSYTEGCNYMVIKCNTCRKISRTKVYTRSERQKVTDHKEVVTETVKLSKKQKKKRKAKQKSEANAGLLLTGTVDKSGEQQPVSSRVQEMKSTPSNIMYSPAGAGPSTSETQSTSMRDVLKKARSKNSRKNAKSSFSKLQNILDKEEHDKKAKGSGNSLANFLEDL